MGETNTQKFTETLWVRAATFRTHKLDNELAVLNETTGAIHLLNQVSAEVYELLDGAHSFAQIVAHILNRYDVAEETVRQDVLKVLGEFDKHGMITDVRT